MLTLLSCFFIMIASANSQTHHVPSHAEDQGPDLPTVGSSLFDKAFSEKNSRGEVVYSIPTPLKKFVEKLGSDSKYVHTILPFSRSLQRPIDLSYDPLLNPRIVFTPFDLHPTQSLLLGKIFFGYVQAKDQIEIISLNEEAGRFEYQIITDYSTSPKVFYVNRGKCLSCHQAQAPIFSPPGWDDTSVGIMGKLLDTRLALDGIKRIDFMNNYFGPNRSDDQIAVFDSFVRESNKMAFDERKWVVGCGQSNACRLGVLLNTVARTSTEGQPYIDASQKILVQSPLSKQNKFSSFLTSFDLNATSITRKYGGLKEVVTRSEAILEIISEIYNLNESNNPASKRDMPISNSELLEPLSLFSQEDMQTLQQEFTGAKQLATVLIQLFENGSPIYSENAVNTPQIMYTLLTTIGSKKAQQYEYWIKKETAPKKLFEGQTLPVFATTELNIFSQRCSQCHAAGLSFPPQFLIGNETQVIHQIRNLKEKILYKLENNLMPPDPISRDELKRSGDYVKLVEYLNRL